MAFKNIEQNQISDLLVGDVVLLDRGYFFIVRQSHELDKHINAIAVSNIETAKALHDLLGEWINENE